MARAIGLARRGLYSTEPNPRVGCVLVREGRVVGEGWHMKAGEPHAERLAIAEAGALARGATAYVTLEPCCHHGRTPPCTEGLLEAGVSEVVAAMVDPNPLVSGQGLAQLAAAGLRVRQGLLAAEAEQLNPGFCRRMRGGLPWVRLKLAQSLDGRTAMANGESKWITGADARRDVQLWRARSSVVLTGSGTVLADDPRLDVRLDWQQLPGLSHPAYLRQPLRVVLDSALRTPPSARILQPPGETLLLHRHGSEQRAATLLTAGARIQQLAGEGERPDLRSVLQHLARLGHNEILIESGHTLAGAALAAGLVDELILYIAPHLMGDSARGLVHLPGLERLSDRIELAWRDLRRVGDDLRIIALPKRRS